MVSAGLAHANKNAAPGAAPVPLHSNGGVQAKFLMHGYNSPNPHSH